MSFFDTLETGALLAGGTAANYVGKQATKLTNQVTGAYSGVATSLGSIHDLSSARLAVTGLLTKNRPNTANTPEAQWTDSGLLANPDWRVKVSTNANILYNLAANGDAGILTPLLLTSGVIFPITPVIQTTHTAKYSPSNLTHSNYAMHFYEGSEVSPISINAEFPIQTIDEGRYLLVALYFFRSATKMFWGSDSLAGTPPPIVFLNGYGDHYFPNVPCVVTSVMHSMPDNVDYIDIPVAGGSTRMPLQSQIQVVLQPMYSRQNITEFNLQDFSKGALLGKPQSTGRKGGFI